MSGNFRYTGRHKCRFVVRVPLPKILLNRPAEHWQERPDLVKQLKEFTDRLEEWCWQHCVANFAVAIDQIRTTEIDVHFELEQDADQFADEWSKTGVDLLASVQYVVSWTD